MAKASQDKVSRYPDSRVLWMSVSSDAELFRDLFLVLTFSLSGCLEVSENHPFNTFIILVHVLLNLCDTFSIEF